MKQIVIYGPPAVGKHEVSLELEKQLGYKRIQRQLTYKTMLTVFDWGSDSFKKVLPEIHTVMMAEAARVGIDLIFSFVYSPARRHVAQGYFDSVEQHGGEICLVRLFSDRETMEKRVAEPKRADMGIMSSLEQLRSYLKENPDIVEPISERSSLEIDAALHTTEEIAHKIISHFKLSKN